jgi:chaperonin GroES
MIDITPCGHRLLIKPKLAEEVTKGGLIIPSAARDKEQHATTEGTILKIGPQCWLAFADGKPWAEVGDTVIYAQYAGHTVRDPETGGLAVLLNDNDIIGIKREG